jgi:hypothetical protein
MTLNMQQQTPTCNTVFRRDSVRRVLRAQLGSLEAFRKETIHFLRDGTHPSWRVLAVRWGL